MTDKQIAAILKAGGFISSSRFGRLYDVVDCRDIRAKVAGQIQKRRLQSLVERGLIKIGLNENTGNCSAYVAAGEDPTASKEVER